MADYLPESPSSLAKKMKPLQPVSPDQPASPDLTQGAHSWRAPTKLPDMGGLQVKPYPLDLLPDALRPWVEDMRARAQFHPDYLAVSVMTCLGAAIGRRCAVYAKQKDDWYEYPNFWGAMVGRPGAMKSPVMASVMKPLGRIERGWQEQYQAELQQYHKDKERYEFMKKADHAKARKAADNGLTAILSDDQPPVEPHCQRLIVTDPTEAKLGEIMRHNPNGLLMELDELSVLTPLFERDPTMRAFLLKAWSAKGEHRIDRIGRGSIFIEALGLSVLGGIQPGIIRQMVKEATDTTAGDGLLQRFQLVAFPDGWSEKWEMIDRYPDQTARENAFKLFDSICGMNPEDFPEASPCGPRGLRFTPEAQEMFNHWYTGLQNSLRRGLDAEVIEAARSKGSKLMLGLALCFQLSEDPGAPAISAPSLERALRWFESAESHMRKLLSMNRQDDVKAATLILSKIADGKLESGFTARDIKQGDWSGLSEPAVNQAGLDLLVHHGWIKQEAPTPGKAGRPTWRHEVHPEFKDFWPPPENNPQNPQNPPP